MLTVISSSGALVSVGTASGEYGLTNVSRVELPAFTYIVCGSHTYTNEGLHDGAVVAVDGSGNIQVTDGPDVQLWAVGGFAAALTVVGFFVFLRWVYRVFFGGAGIYRPVSD